MNDLISREELLETIRSMTVTMGGRELFLPSLKDAVIDAISIAPAVSPTEWIEWYTDQIKQEFHYRIVKEDPAVDAVPVVRCRECKRHRKEGCIDMVWCGKWGSQRLPDDYCSYGERRESDGGDCCPEECEGAQDGEEGVTDEAD